MKIITQLIRNFTRHFLLFYLLFINKGVTQSLSPIDTSSMAKYSTEILDKWMDLQIKLMSSTIASFNGPFVRIYAYSGVTAYLSIEPGISKSSPYWFSNNKLNGLPALPDIKPGQIYHWPSSLNAALASINRYLFPTTNSFNRAKIDSLESIILLGFYEQIDSGIINRSKIYGSEIAKIVFSWAQSDGILFANNPYTVPHGPGKWEPTPPNYSQASSPFYGALRTMVKNSIDSSQPPPPPIYSEDTASDFYKMNLDVYLIDKNLNADQKNIVLFWRDINPGYTAPGHWLNVLRQIFKKESTHSKLDKSVFAWALSGISLNDTWISCWKTRYMYNLMRPVTYIRKIMKQEAWLPFITTPPHPEYTSGFAAMAGAVTSALSLIYGDKISITDHTYDYLGMLPRSFDSFSAMANEAGDSKYFGGIHYKISVDRGLWQGRVVSKQIYKLIFFKSQP